MFDALVRCLWFSIFEFVVGAIILFILVQTSLLKSDSMSQQQPCLPQPAPFFLGGATSWIKRCFSSFFSKTQPQKCYEKEDDTSSGLTERPLKRAKNNSEIQVCEDADGVGMAGMKSLSESLSACHHPQETCDSRRSSKFKRKREQSSQRSSDLERITDVRDKKAEATSPRNPTLILKALNIKETVLNNVGEDDGQFPHNPSSRELAPSSGGEPCTPTCVAGDASAASSPPHVTPLNDVVVAPSTERIISDCARTSSIDAALDDEEERKMPARQKLEDERNHEDVSEEKIDSSTSTVQLPYATAATLVPCSPVARTPPKRRRKKLIARKSIVRTSVSPTIARGAISIAASSSSSAPSIPLFRLFPNEILLQICMYHQGNYSVLSSLVRTSSGFHTVLKENDHLWKIGDPEHEYYSAFDVKNRTFRIWGYTDRGDSDTDDEINERLKGSDSYRTGEREKREVVTCREVAGRISRRNAMELEQESTSINAILDELGKTEFRSWLRNLCYQTTGSTVSFQDDESLMTFALLLEANVVHALQKLAEMHYATSMYAFFNHPFQPPLDRIFSMLRRVQYQHALDNPFEHIHRELPGDQYRPAYNRAIRRMAYRGGLCEIDWNLVNNIWYFLNGYALKIIQRLLIIDRAYGDHDQSLAITKSLIEQQVKELGLPFHVAYVHEFDEDNENEDGDHEDSDNESISWSTDDESSENEEDVDEDLIFDTEDEC